MDFDTSAVVLAWGAIVLLSFAMAGILRQMQILAARGTEGSVVSGPVIGTKLRVLDGVVDADADVSILLFLDAACESCGWLLPHLRDSKVEGRDVKVRALYRGEAPDANSASVEIIDEQDEVFRRLGISATPFAVGVTSSGRVVASDVIGSPATLQAFFAQAIERSEQR